MQQNQVRTIAIGVALAAIAVIGGCASGPTAMEADVPAGAAERIAPRVPEPPPVKSVRTTPLPADFWRPDLTTPRPERSPRRAPRVVAVEPRPAAVKPSPAKPVVAPPNASSSAGPRPTPERPHSVTPEPPPPVAKPAPAKPTASPEPAPTKPVIAPRVVKKPTPAKPTPVKPVPTKAPVRVVKPEPEKPEPAKPGPRKPATARKPAPVEPVIAKAPKPAPVVPMTARAPQPAPAKPARVAAAPTRPVPTPRPGPKAKPAPEASPPAGTEAAASDKRLPLWMPASAATALLALLVLWLGTIRHGRFRRELRALFGVDWHGRLPLSQLRSFMQAHHSLQERLKSVIDMLEAQQSEDGRFYDEATTRLDRLSRSIEQRRRRIVDDVKQLAQARRGGETSLEKALRIHAGRMGLLDAMDDLAQGIAEARGRARL